MRVAKTGGSPLANVARIVSETLNDFEIAEPEAFEVRAPVPFAELSGFVDDIGPMPRKRPSKRKASRKARRKNR